MKIDKIVEILKKEIEDGKYDETGKIPTEESLVDKFDTSKYSIRKAIDRLEGMSYLYKIHGSGIYLRERKKYGYIDLRNISGISSEFDSNKVLSIPIKIEISKANEEDIKIFNCDKNTEFYRIVRLRCIDNVPYAIEYSSFKKEIVRYLDKKIVSSSIFQYLKDKLNLKIGFADKYILARKLTKFESEKLDLNYEDPTIIVHDIVHLKTGEKFANSETVYNYKLAKFFLLSRVD
ncbi:GntR family transcriptional regulator [Helcococcus kunzii]|uniref:GntR family transcriptional regulator n=1 Tax=Helcococcus kunzii TaxID=40091 RepID=UPI0024AE4DB5|nr:GntR family transcriptional regulator [Helcococcus kunzii]